MVDVSGQYLYKDRQRSQGKSVYDQYEALSSYAQGHWLVVGNHFLGQHRFGIFKFALLGDLPGVGHYLRLLHLHAL
jgi:hypothetical protein